MPLFICRWQNGDFSAVSAPSREKAIDLLDEVGNADVADLFTVPDFMVHFRLKETTEDVEEMIPVELEGFGEDTVSMLCDRVYPVYTKAVLEADANWPDDDTQVTPEHVDAALGNLNDALATERKRRWGSKKPEIYTDPEAAHLQKTGHDIPKCIAEQVVTERRRRRIHTVPPRTNKIQ